MALVLNDRVKETTTTTGTGTLNLAGAATNFETFVAGIGDGNTVYYAIVHQTAAEFEVGLGTVTDGSPDTLSRTTILSSSNSDSAVSFSSGTKDVFCTLPASKAVFEDASNVVSISTIDIVDGSTTNGTITSSSNSLTLNGRNSGTLIFQTGGSERARLNSDALTLTSAKIAHASDFTLDVGGDLFLDADGAGIFLSDGGTSVGRFLLSSSDLTIGALVQDKDIIFKGNDGGSSITALTLDMSNAGRATFNENVTVGGNLDVSGADVTITANIIHAGDTDTFFGFNDANTFRIVTGGTEALRVDSSQRVGIGTTSPSEKLSISPDTDVSAEIGKAHIGSVGHSDYAGFAHVDKNTTSDYALLQGAAGDTFLNASDGQRIKFRINNSEKATIDSSGNLGIGTSSPSQTLHVNGNAFVSGQTFLGDASGDTVTLTGSLAHAGDFTIDVGGDITLDADGGDIKLSNGGTQFANFGDATGAVHIDAVVSDDDIKFRGVSDGTTFTALTLDMSDRGNAIFGAGATFNRRTEISTDSDYQLRIDNGSNIWFNRVQGDGTYAIHLNGTGNIFHATSTGIGVTGNADISGTLSVGNLNVDSADIIKIARDNLSTGQAGLTYDSSGGQFGLIANHVMALIQTVDSNGSGLNAATLDGQEGTHYRINVYNNSGTLLN